MEIVNYFRAKFLNSSEAAFSLADKDRKYLPFAEKIIKVKNENAYADLIKTHSSLPKEMTLKSKIFKYESFLGGIEAIKVNKINLLDYKNVLPRLNVTKINGNNHEYFLSYNNKPKIISITAARERLI